MSQSRLRRPHTRTIDARLENQVTAVPMGNLGVLSFLATMNLVFQAYRNLLKLI
jgi:hypothetical protein